MVQSMPTVQDPSPEAVAFEIAGRDAIRQLEAAVRLWLAWNEAYEELTQRMFRDGNDRHRMEYLANTVDQLRQQAVTSSQEILP